MATANCERAALPNTDNCKGDVTAKSNAARPPPGHSEKNKSPSSPNNLRNCSNHRFHQKPMNNSLLYCVSASMNWKLKKIRLTLRTNAKTTRSSS